MGFFVCWLIILFGNVMFIYYGWNEESISLPSLLPKRKNPLAKYINYYIIELLTDKSVVSFFA